MPKNNAQKNARATLRAAKRVLTGTKKPKNPKKVVKVNPLPKVQSVPNPLGQSEQMLSDEWEKQAKKVNVPGKGKTPLVKAKDLGANQPTLKWVKSAVIEKLPAVAKSLGWATTAAARLTAAGTVAGALVPENKVADRSNYSKGEPGESYVQTRDRNLMADPNWPGGKFGTVGTLISGSPSESSKKGKYNDEHMRSLQEMMPKISSAPAPKGPPPINKNKNKPGGATPVPRTEPEKTFKTGWYGQLGDSQNKTYEPSGFEKRDRDKEGKVFSDWAKSKLKTMDTKPDALSQGLANLLGVKVTPGHQVADPEGSGLPVLTTSPHAKVDSSKSPAQAYQEQKDRKKKGWSNTAFPRK